MDLGGRLPGSNSPSPDTFWLCGQGYFSLTSQFLTFYIVTVVQQYPTMLVVRMK